MSVSRRYWLETATKKIRFSGDREAVRQELEGHLLEREERYLAQGMSESEASRAATADMGDPDEVAEALGRIHSPWWGYLWKISRWALVIVVLMLCFQLYEELQPWGRLRPDFTPYEPQAGDITTWANDRTSETLAVWEMDGSVKLGDYRVTAPTAYLEHSDSFTYDDGTVSEEYYELTIWLKATTWRIWEPLAADQFMILERGEAIDSNGFRYAWAPQYDPNHNQIRSLFCSTFPNPLSTWFHVNLDLPNGHVPDWVDIPIGYNDHTIRVDLKEEVIR